MDEWLQGDLAPVETVASGDSLALMAYRRLKSLIVGGAMFPGTPLREADLSERLGVSRTPVREALRMLRSEGLVQGTAHKGTHVAHISRQEVIEAYEVREWLEPPLAARAAVNADEQLFQNLSEIVGQIPSNPLTHEEAVRAEQADASFHELVCRGSGNGVALDLVRRAREITQRAAFFVAPGRYYRSREEHMELLDALRTRDSKRAEVAMRKHIMAARMRISPSKEADL